MRIFTASAFLFLMLFKLQAQPIFNIRVTLPRQLPANTAEWAGLPQPIIISAQAKPVQGRIPPEVMESRVVVTLERNGAKACGSYNQSNAPMSSFTTPVKTWTGAQAVGLLGQECTLPGGDYQFCIEFFGMNRATGAISSIAEKKCVPFTIASNDNYNAPNLVSPENEKKYNETELGRPITFRWTPLVPKPTQSITYRLKVWQLMQGQNGTSAMRTNQPIVTKDVDNITQAIVNSVITGPCRPPYLCDFVWNVQALTRDGKPIGSNNGTSEIFRFSAAQTGTIQPPVLQLPANNSPISLADAMKSIRFRWTAVDPKPQEPVTYRLKVWQLMQGQNGTSAMRTNKPIVTKDVADITEANISGIYTGPCRPPYLCDFIWEVQAVNRQGNPVGSNEGKSEAFSFNVREDGQAKPPTLLSPSDKSSIGANDAKTINFRWTAIDPKPQEPVTYRLKVWQLMQGQNGTSAMRTNKPIVTKDVIDITEATVSGIYTGPCRPPYLCDFIWEVQAVNRQGKPIGPNEGKSGAFAFAVSQYIIQLDSIKVNCTNTPGVYSFSYTITNPNAGTAQLNLFQVTSSVPAGASIGSFSPPLNTNIASGSPLTITGTINAAPNLSNICIGAEIKDQVNNFWKASKDTCINVVPCKCDACDEKNFTLNVPVPQQISFNNNNIIYNQPVTITSAKTVKSVTADLVYVEMVPENDWCIPCNKDDVTYGHFGNGTNTQQWISNNTSPNLNISITTPQLTPCCKAKFRWCIRYKIEFTDCTSCNKLVCYEKEKAGCDNPNANNPK